MIDPKFNPYLSKIFNSPPILKLACTGNSKYIKSVVKDSGFYKAIEETISWKELFDKVYSYLKAHYRSEYVYKNAVANKILLGRHSLNTSTLLTEFRVGKSKADIVILNGTSSVYEIKSEFDTTERIEEQMRSYEKVFDFINIVTHESHLEKIDRIIKPKVGIFLLTKNLTLKTIRKPTSNKVNVEPKCIFDSLRKNEYCEIIRKQFGKIPNVPNTKIFSESKMLFSTLLPDLAHDEMVEVLRKRSKNDSFKNFIESLPSSLKVVGLATNLNEKQRKSFSNILKSEFQLG